MCENSDSGMILDSFIDKQGWFKRMNDSKGLSYDDYLKNFVLKGRIYRQGKILEKSEFFNRKEGKLSFVESLRRNPLRQFECMYITDSDDFARAIFYAGSWVGKKDKKKKSFVAPDTLYLQ